MNTADPAEGAGDDPGAELPEPGEQGTAPGGERPQTPAEDRLDKRPEPGELPEPGNERPEQTEPGNAEAKQ